MKCPNDHAAKQLVVESRQSNGFVYRRRMCCLCEVKYVTKEAIHNGPMSLAGPDKSKK